MAIKIYPENIMRIQFETEKINKIEKCDILECRKTPLFLVNMSKSTFFEGKRF